MSMFAGYSYELEGILRLLIAALLGGVMGLERTRKRRDAGFRTYMLVALGSCMTVLVGELMARSVGAGVDTTRIAAAAVTGVGFIGAGSIITSRSLRVTGLTTAAGLWVCVSVGLAVGCGYYIGGAALVGIAIAATVLGERLQDRFLRHRATIRFSVTFEGEEHVLPFIREVSARGYEISGLDAAPMVGRLVGATFLVHIPRQENHRSIIAFFRGMPGVLLVEII